MILDGKKVSENVRQQIAEKVAQLKQQTGKVPKLNAILVGEDPASQVYVRNKGRACEKAGMESNIDRLSAETSREELLNLIHQYNQDPSINGILVQLPLPDHIDEQIIIEAIDPMKDVDCFHPYNVGKLVTGNPVFFPATPFGIIEILKFYNISTAGKHVVVLGRSNIVGKPMANMLVQKAAYGNATVTIAHSRTANLSAITRQADILVAAIGKAEFVKADMVEEGSVIIDVGINRVEDKASEKGYKLVGDVDYNDCLNKVSAITPVPGGVGPMTITMLLQNTLTAFEVQNGLR